jgi:hypothetical protein
MLLEIDAEEYFGLEVAALDPPTGQHLQCAFDAVDAFAEAAGKISIHAAGQQHLQEQAVLLEAAGRHQQAAMGESAVAPDVAAGKQNDARLVVVIGPCRTGENADATDQENRGAGHRRGDAPSATHRGPQAPSVRLQNSPAT